MKEMLINKDLQFVEKDFWICDAEEDTLRGVRRLTMTVTDGSIQRYALWENTDAKIEDMLGTFKQISGTILHGDVLMVNEVHETHYSQIELDRFFKDTQMPVDVMYKYMTDLSSFLPPLIAVPCMCMVEKFEKFTSKKPIAEPELEARIQATEESLYTVLKWQKMLQHNDTIDDSALIMAGVIIGAFMPFFENDLLLPDWNFIPAEILSCNFDYLAKGIKLEKDVTNKIKKIIYALYYTEATEMENLILSNKFFKHS